MTRDIFHVRPPHGNGTTDKQASGTPVSVIVTSSAAQAIGNTKRLEYVMIMATTLCHIRFGLAAVGAATTNDFPIPPNVWIKLDLKLDEETHFRVIRDTADGALYWYLTG